MCFANIFFLSVACILVLLKRASTEQKFLIFLNLFIKYFLYGLYFWDQVSETFFYPLDSEGFLLFFPETVIVLWFIFNFAIFFKLMFINSVNLGRSRFLFV